MMLIDDRHRALDFQYILWRFDTSQLDTSELKFLDNGPGGAEEQEEERFNLNLRRMVSRAEQQRVARLHRRHHH